MYGGDPKFAPLLLGLGIQALSMAATTVPHVKQRIRSLDYLAMLLDDFNALAT